MSKPLIIEVVQLIMTCFMSPALRLPILLAASSEGQSLDNLALGYNT